MAQIKTQNVIDIRGDIATTPLFWDCECGADFIHPAAQPQCPNCGADRDDQPDSRVPEVLALCSGHLAPEQRKMFEAAL